MLCFCCFDDIDDKSGKKGKESNWGWRVSWVWSQEKRRFIDFRSQFSAIWIIFWIKLEKLGELKSEPWDRLSCFFADPFFLQMTSKLANLQLTAYHCACHLSCSFSTGNGTCLLSLFSHPCRHRRCVDFILTLYTYRPSVQQSQCQFLSIIITFSPHSANCCLANTGDWMSAKAFCFLL